MSKPPVSPNPPVDTDADTARADATPSTAAAIRAALKNKAQGGAVGQRSGRDAHEQKPPFPPRGTRRSMGKR